MAGDEPTRNEPGDPTEDAADGVLPDKPDDVPGEADHVLDGPDDVPHEPDVVPGEADHEPDQATADVLASGPPATTGRRRRRRVSKWDRPPEPHDWRWAVGGVGRVLVSVGLLMFAFVAYQLWGTGIQEARAQSRLEDEFTEMLATASTLPPATTTVTTIPVPDTEPTPGTTEPGSAPSSSSTTSTSTTLAPPAVLDRPPVGDPVALLELPSIGVEKTIVEGVTTGVLEDGPGHFPETPFPGQFGNAAIAGHRTTYGHPFLDLDDLEIGDDVFVTTLAGRYTYVVSELVVVEPDDYAAVIPTVDPNVATLTLLTCDPPYSTKRRLVVLATIDTTRSSVVTLPTPADDAPAAGQLPGEGTGSTEPDPIGTTPVDTAVSAAPADGTSAEDTSASTPSDRSEPVTTDVPSGEAVTTAATAAEGTTVPEDSATAFGAGWFDDPDAWPQVALWGFALTAIALAAYTLSRKVRHDWVGATLGLGPFVVALYFWFENVNRLLPPGL